MPGAGELRMVRVNTAALPVLCCQSFTGAALWLQVWGVLPGREREGFWGLKKKIWVNSHQNAALGRQARK